MAPHNKSRIRSKKASQTHSANAALRRRDAAALFSPSTSAPVDAATADPRLTRSPLVASTSPADVSTLSEFDVPYLAGGFDCDELEDLSMSTAASTPNMSFESAETLPSVVPLGLDRGLQFTNIVNDDKMSCLTRSPLVASTSPADGSTLSDFDVPYLAGGFDCDELEDPSMSAAASTPNMSFECAETLPSVVPLDLDRGLQFTNIVNDDKMSCLARAYLRSNKIGQAIKCFIKAGDAQSFEAVIEMGQQYKTWTKLFNFCTMARRTINDQRIDTCMAWCLCNLHQLSNLKMFLSASNSAQVLLVGDRCLKEQLFDAAIILFNDSSVASVLDFGELALTWVKLTRFNDAVAAAEKANCPRTWKAVLKACMDANAFHLSAKCSLHLLTSDDNAATFCMNTYHNHGSNLSLRLLDIMVSVTATGRASGAVVTALAVAYADRRMRSNLKDHIQRFQVHFQLPEVVETCRLRSCNILWSALLSVLPNLYHPPPPASSPATHSSDAAVQEAIEFFRAARAAQAGKQPVCVSDIIKGNIRDSPHCVNLLAAIRQGLVTQLPGCRSTPPPPPPPFPSFVLFPSMSHTVFAVLCTAAQFLPISRSCWTTRDHARNTSGNLCC
jgi:hypothetical protein